MTPEKILSHPARVLSQEQRESYFRDGYLLLPGILSDEWIRRLRAVSDEFVEKSRSVATSDTVSSRAFAGSCWSSSRARSSHRKWQRPRNPRRRGLD